MGQELNARAYFRSLNVHTLDFSLALRSATLLSQDVL